MDKNSKLRVLVCPTTKSTEVEALMLCNFLNRSHALSADFMPYLSVRIYSESQIKDIKLSKIIWFMPLKRIVYYWSKIEARALIFPAADSMIIIGFLIRIALAIVSIPTLLFFLSNVNKYRAVITSSDRNSFLFYEPLILFAANKCGKIIYLPNFVSESSDAMRRQTRYPRQSSSSILKISLIRSWYDRLDSASKHFYSPADFFLLKWIGILSQNPFFSGNGVSTFISIADNSNDHLLNVQRKKIIPAPIYGDFLVRKKIPSYQEKIKVAYLLGQFYEHNYISLDESLHIQGSVIKHLVDNKKLSVDIYLHPRQVASTYKDFFEKLQCKATEDNIRSHILSYDLIIHCGSSVALLASKLGIHSISYEPLDMVTTKGQFSIEDMDICKTPSCIMSKIPNINFTIARNNKKTSLSSIDAHNSYFFKVFTRRIHSQ